MVGTLLADDPKPDLPAVIEDAGNPGTHHTREHRIEVADLPELTDNHVPPAQQEERSLTVSLAISGAQLKHRAKQDTSTSPQNIVRTNSITAPNLARARRLNVVPSKHPQRPHTQLEPQYLAGNVAKLVRLDEHAFRPSRFHTIPP